MITTTLSVKNQITIPTFILNLLDVKKKDRLLVDIKKDTILVKPVGKSLVDSLAGSISIPEDKKGIPFEEVLTSTKEIVSKKLATQ